jgi:hypothetical protein
MKNRLFILKIRPLKTNKPYFPEKMQYKLQFNNLWDKAGRIIIQLNGNKIATHYKHKCISIRK